MISEISKMIDCIGNTTISVHRMKKLNFPSIKYLFSMLYRLTNGLTSAKIIIATKDIE